MGVWTRVDKWREEQKKSKEALPWARVELGAEQVESNTHSTRVLNIEFHNLTRHRWRGVHAKIIEPVSATIRKRDEPATAWSREVDLDWIMISVAEDGLGRSQGVLAMRFERLPADGPPQSREVAVKLTVEEVSAKRRRHRFEARTARHF